MRMDILLILVPLGLWFSLLAWPLWALRRWRKTGVWDYIYPVGGFVAWFSLGLMDVGSLISMTNFVVELFLVGCVSVLVPWMRLGMARRLHVDHTRGQRWLIALTFVPILLALILRLSLGTLPV
jgi:hypothetical protein